MELEKFSTDEIDMVKRFTEAFPFLKGQVIFGETKDGNKNVTGNAIAEISAWWINELKS